MEKYVPPNDLQAHDVIINDNMLMDDEGEDVYEVERIDGQELGEGGIWLYKVIWKGYLESEATLEPASSISVVAMRAYVNKKEKAEARELQ